MMPHDVGSDGIILGEWWVEVSGPKAGVVGNPGSCRVLHF